MTNLVDRFLAAVSVLAGDGHIKQRLIRAFQDNLAEIDEDDLPVSVKERFAEIRVRMHSVAPLKGEGPIRASVRKMSCTEAGECGESIVALFADILRDTDRLETSLPLASGDAEVVPPFLVKSVS